MTELKRPSQDMMQDLVAPPNTADVLAATNIRIIHVNQAFYKLKEELCTGPFGLVLLYESKRGYQLASKIFKEEINA